MQTIKEKMNDMSSMRKAKAEAKQEEKEEKELAKARVGVAHEVRLAREAEAAMDLHVNKAAGKAAEHERKHPSPRLDTNTPDSYASARHPSSPAPSPRYSTNSTFGSDPQDPYSCDTAGDGYIGNRSGGPPTNLI